MEVSFANSKLQKVCNSSKKLRGEYGPRMADLIQQRLAELADAETLDYTCWSVCANDFSFMQSFEARRFRDGLNGGLFGAGQITIEGVVIPIMPYDFELINGYSTFDAYLLTRGVGNRRWLYGQYNNMNPVAAKIEGGDYSAIDGGRVLTWSTPRDMTCEERIAEMQPRLILEAPWAQVRVSDISCSALGGPLTSDPWGTYFPYNTCEENQA